MKKYVLLSVIITGLCFCIACSQEKALGNYEPEIIVGTVTEVVDVNTVEMKITEVFKGEESTPMEVSDIVTVNYEFCNGGKLSNDLLYSPSEGDELSFNFYETEEIDGEYYIEPYSGGVNGEDYLSDGIVGTVSEIVDDNSFVVKAVDVQSAIPQTQIKVGDSVTVKYDKVVLNSVDTDYKPEIGDEVHLSVHSTEKKNGNYYVEVFLADIIKDDESSAE